MVSYDVDSGAFCAMMTLIGDQTTYQVDMPACAPYQVRNHRSFVNPILKACAAIVIPVRFFFFSSGLKHR